MIITVAKGVVPLQASCHRGCNVQDNVQGHHQEGEISLSMCKAFHQKCELQLHFFTSHVFGNEHDFYRYSELQ